LSAPHTRRRPPSLLLLAGLLAVPAFGDTRPPVDIPGLREAQEHDRAIAALDVRMEKEEWEAARRAASDLLERSKTIWHGSIQRALVRLAIAESRLGRDAEAFRHWRAVQALGGGSLADPLIARLGPLSGRLMKMPVRAYGEVPAGVESAEAREGFLPARRAGGGDPTGNLGCTGARGPLWARFQAVIDAEGNLTQPAIVGSSVCFSFEVLKAAESWTFEPARKGGVAVAGLYTERIHPPALLPFESVAAGGTGTPEVLSLLRSGEHRKAEERADRLWNAALEAGSPSRPYTVSLLALRAVALAARPDPESQRRAICLWEAVQGDEPAFYDLDLRTFGEAGRRLAPHRFGEVRLNSGGPDLENAPPGARMERPEVVRETRRSPQARFPPGSYGASRVFLETMLDEEGSIREPLLFEREEGFRGFDLEALDAVCSWRFQPARLAGQPVGILYVLTMSVGPGPGASAN
jgi:hypothetical protein